jgi:hypothetical protein
MRRAHYWRNASRVGTTRSRRRREVNASGASAGNLPRGLSRSGATSVGAPAPSPSWGPASLVAHPVFVACATRAECDCPIAGSGDIRSAPPAHSRATRLPTDREVGVRRQTAAISNHRVPTTNPRRPRAATIGAGRGARTLRPRAGHPRIHNRCTSDRQNRAARERRLGSGNGVEASVPPQRKVPFLLNKTPRTML